LNIGARADSCPTAAELIQGRIATEAGSAAFFPSLLQDLAQEVSATAGLLFCDRLFCAPIIHPRPVVEASGRVETVRCVRYSLSGGSTDLPETLFWNGGILVKFRITYCGQ